MFLMTKASWKLLKSMYSTASAGRVLKGVDQATLLLVLQLADRLGADRCTKAAVQALVECELEWSTVISVYRLPPACPENKAYASICDKCVNVLLQQVGDIDGMWLQEYTDRLLQLPLSGLRQLLMHSRTFASSENTIAYTCLAWLARHECTSDEKQQLLECIRMPHVSSLYLTGFLPH